MTAEAPKPSAVELTNTVTSRPAPLLTATHEHPDVAPVVRTGAAKPATIEEGEEIEGEEVVVPSAKAGEKPPRKPGPMAKRIEELASEKRALAEENARLKEADAARKKEIEAQTARASVTSEAEPKRADFEDTPDGEDLYKEARAEHRARKAIREEIAKEKEAAAKRATEEQDAARAKDIEQRAAAWKDQVKVAKAAHEDFDEVIEGCEEKLTDAMAFSLGNSRLGAELWYWLAAHPAEVKRIRELPVGEQPLEIGALQHRLGPELRKQTKAPRPVDTVGQHNAGNEPTLNDLAEAGDMEGYAARRQAELNAKAEAEAAARGRGRKH